MAPISQLHDWLQHSIRRYKLCHEIGTVRLLDLQLSTYFALHTDERIEAVASSPEVKIETRHLHTRTDQ